MSVAGQEALQEHELDVLDAHWRAANYLSACQLYLLDNPLLAEPLSRVHLKPRLLGHWGTVPGLNFVYTHLNRVITRHDLDMIYVTGPGHGGPALLANTWLEGSYSETNTDVTRDVDGMRLLFRQFSFPGGVPSHVAPEVPGSIHEGGELGYSLAHAFGAAFDNPELIVACVIGDGEAETGPLAAGWHGNKFLDPVHDGAVLPILHLNGYKIANPAILARIPHDELDALLRGYGYAPYYVTVDQPEQAHQRMATVLDDVVEQITLIRQRARRDGVRQRPQWPLIVLRSPKGWTGPREVDGSAIEGTWRAHQVPLPAANHDPEHLRMLEEWLRGYRPEELFDHEGRPLPHVLEQIPGGERRMGANPHANGGMLLRRLRLPDVSRFRADVAEHGRTYSAPTRALGAYLADVVRRNEHARNFRVFGPDETASNRLDALYGVTGKQWQPETLDGDEHLVPSGRVVEVLSEHLCQGFLEGYLLTGRHGLFNCYEAFIHIVDSMFNQHAKWLKVHQQLRWRHPVASLNYLLSSHVWRQDHNGFSHQDPGFIDHVVNKKAEVIRVYLPPDTNSLLAVADQCLRSHDLINVIVAGKNSSPNWLSIDDAVQHCARGAGIWEWASNDYDGAADVVLACAGDAPTHEVLAAASLLRKHLPSLNVRVVNVVDLMRLQPHTEHPHGMTDAEFDALFTTDRPVIFAYHGYPWLIHRLTYRRTNHVNLHVRGYKEEGTTTTPFDMLVLNDMDRFKLVIDVLERVPLLGARAARLHQHMADQRIKHRRWIRQYGEDLPEVREWTWR
ncbi:phosphoketolase family protein [Haloechinothrix sp. LS1_15]|uniref:phosphoketolase family protein n=1 Tax=Haloechinothrix sp. LS1_15 TaxID=2652248 RepID=UPI002948B0A1|nr:phosphoketolase family protein [Haloechinothrix sp. LS1_15]MDV6014257.1 phosphoketolase family protein [Haloechinothrix sp. LS1_15]